MAAVDVRAYGVTDAIMQRAREASGLEDPVVGRVLSQAHELYRVVGEQGELFAEAAGKLRHAARSAADFPAVGDFVLLARADDAGGRAIVSQVLPRTRAIVRQAAAHGRASAGPAAECLRTLKAAIAEAAGRA